MVVTSPPVFELPQRGLFDVVAANDVAALLTLVRGDNPFDVSPGMELIRLKKRSAPQPYAENTGVVASVEANIDVAQIPRSRDGRGNGAVHVAAGFGLSCMLKILVDECGCAVDEYNEVGLTPLHVAALHGHADCVRLLYDLGAAPLSTTRTAASLSSSGEQLFCGRTTLFLAHYAGQAAVLSFLLPFYSELVQSACEGQTAVQVWEKAVAQQNTQLLALLLDAVETATALTGPLPLSFGFDVEAGLRDALPAVLAATLPAEHCIAREQLFLFERLVRLGYVGAATPFTPSQTVLDRVLSTAQVKAWRALTDDGAVDPCRCDIEAVHSSGYTGNGEAELRLLIAEAKAHAQYCRAKRSYEKKGDDATRREAVVSSREAWKELQTEMRHKGISPVSTTLA